MSTQTLIIVVKNPFGFELKLQQKFLSYGEWAGNGPPASIAPRQEVRIRINGEDNLQGYFAYITTLFGEGSPLAVAWRYQGGQPGHMVTVSRENFEISPPFTELRTPTAEVEVTISFLE